MEAENTENVGNKKEIIIDPKYAAPYPQAFYRFWPKHALKASFVVLVVLTAIVMLSYYFQLPVDPNMPPLPDEGANIPAPEWYLFFLFQPFWYLTGDDASLRAIGTFWIPVVLIISLLVLPFFSGKKAKEPGTRLGLGKRIVLGLAAWLVWGVGISAVVGSGYPAKTTGCVSCHNPMMGVRQALPPEDMGKYYRENRQQQIEVGRYRIGNTMGVGDSYKDANWQLRHFYEPTMTW